MKCEAMSDRMPLVVTGESTWSEEEKRHFAACSDCRSEWNVVQAAYRVSRSAPRLEPDRISAAVLHRLRTEPAAVRGSRTWWIAGAGIAAAAGLLAIFLGRQTPVPNAPTSHSEFAIPISELDSLTHEQLRLVLEAIEEPLETPMTNEAPSLLDLDDQQLERVLRSLEG